MRDLKGVSIMPHEEVKSTRERRPAEYGLPSQLWQVTPAAQHGQHMSDDQVGVGSVVNCQNNNNFVSGDSASPGLPMFLKEPADYQKNSSPETDLFL